MSPAKPASLASPVTPATEAPTPVEVEFEIEEAVEMEEIEVEEIVWTTKTVVTANYNYKAADDEEISLSKGEEVEVLGESEHDGWLLGINSRREKGVYFLCTPYL
jgi:hypothetical protein